MPTTLSNETEQHSYAARENNRPLIYKYPILLGQNIQSTLLLVCRLYFGWLFVTAGFGKLQNIDPFIKLLEGFDIGAPTVAAYAAALTELIGGFCLMIGFASRLAAIPLIFVMAVAYATVHIDSVRLLATEPSKFVNDSPFIPMLIALFVLAFGPGKYSIDSLINQDR